MSVNFLPDMPDLTEYSGTQPFRYWCHKILPLTYDASLSYYELLCKVVLYLNNVIKNDNAIVENMEKLQNAYIELQNYVNNYFTNLDVQDEINKKLDEMFASGELPEMIVNLLSQFRVFDTVADMISSKPDIGIYVRTLGYTVKGTGGANYLIVPENSQSDVAIDLGNGSYAEPIDIYCTPEQYGALKDGSTDDSDAFIMCLKTNKIILLNSGTYCIGKSIDITKGNIIKGCGIKQCYIKNIGNSYLFNIICEYTNKCYISDISFISDKDNGFIYADSGTWGSSFTLNNFTIKGFSNIFYFVSAFKVEVNNGDIDSIGTNTLTYDFISTPTKRFNNCITFNNVWFHTTGNVRGNICFNAIHTRQVTFNDCQFDKLNTIWYGGDTKDIKSVGTKTTTFNNCWFESNEYLMYIRTVLKSSETELPHEQPLFNNCRLVEQTKYNRYVYEYNENHTSNKIGYDYGKGLPVIRNIIESKNPISAFIKDREIIIDELTQFSNKGVQVKQPKIYEITNKGARLTIPLNVYNAKYYGGTNFEYNLGRPIYYDTDIGLLYDVYIIALYKDYSKYCKHFKGTSFQGTYMHLPSNAETLYRSSGTAQSSDLTISRNTSNTAIINIKSSVEVLSLNIVVEYNVSGAY